MAADMLEAIGFLLDGEQLDLLKRRSDELGIQSPGIAPDEVIEKAILELRSEGKITDGLAQRLSLAISIAKISGNNRAIIKAVDNDRFVNSIREFALRFDTAAIEKTIAADVPGSGGTSDGDTSSHERPVLEAATAIRTAAFHAAPTATIQGMVMNDKVKLTNTDPNVKADVVGVLSKLDDTAMGNTAIASLPTLAPEVIDAIPVERRPAVTHELKMLSRSANMANSTKSMEALVNAGLTTSFEIASLPKKDFMAAVSSRMSTADSSEIHDNAVSRTFRNQNMLIGLLQMVQGTGLQVIDGQESAAFRALKIQELAAAQSFDLNFEALFGSMDQCVCDECTTVYSPASYFVELLQYLRKTPLNAEISTADASTEGQTPSIEGTVLQKLFRRRPDLGNLQLTCENTNTILPYIDLANEVMESFILSLDAFADGTKEPWNKQAIIDVYNVGDQDSNELLSQPQNTNDDAYRILAAASYPLTLPYHQPIDTQRVFLDFLKVPRVELLRTFRQKPAKIDMKIYDSLTGEDLAKLQTRLVDLQDTVLDRQVDAETLGLVQEEYLILTGQVFFEQDFFAVTEKLALTQEEYRKRVGLLEPHRYWGYPSFDRLSSADESTRTGLQFVKRQFLPRSGITYADLVALLETGFINPRQPKGRDKRIFEQLLFSYKFLMTLIDNKGADDKKRLRRLAEFLVQTTNVLHLADLLTDEVSGVKTSGKGSKTNCVSDDEIREWVYSKFEGLGKIIVLDSGEGPRLPIEGEVVVKTLESDRWTVSILGTLSTDGTIKDSNGMRIASVNIASRVLMGSAADNITANDQHKDQIIEVRNKDGWTVAVVEDGYLKNAMTENRANVEWYLPAGMGGGCNIDNVRLIHLDGTSLSSDEWDRFQKFIRLWRRLGWSVSEIDMALKSVNAPDATPVVPVKDDDCGCKSNGTKAPVNGQNELITFENFTFGNGLTNGTSANGIAKASWIPTVGVDTIHQLAAIKKLVPMTGLPVEQLLTFWTNIPTRGPKSLYSRLFFSSNIKKNDAVFGPDYNGDYFVDAHCRISDNLLVILAAFGMKAADMDYLLGNDVGGRVIPLSAPVPNILSIETLSAVYRYSLLSRVLGCGVTGIGQVLAGGFPDPFQSPTNCLDLLQTWDEMSQAGFTWAQLRYVADDIPSILDPLAPDTKTVLQTAKTLHDGIVAIRNEHQLPNADEEVGTEVVKSKAGLIFDEAVVSAIMQLLNGETGTFMISGPTTFPGRAVFRSSIPPSVRCFSEIS
jgi:hypothetical protein